MQEFAGEGNRDHTCSYGTKYLLKQISALRKQIPGVIAAHDIEHIHQMRVATRRLRSALPLFPLCFPQKKIQRWRRDLRNTARSLGKARDLDVQISFLTGFIADLKAGRPVENRVLLPSVVPETSPPVPFNSKWYTLSISYRKLVTTFQSALSRAWNYFSHTAVDGDLACGDHSSRQADLVPGLEYLLFRKNKERSDYQSEVEKTIWQMEKAGILGAMEKYLQRHRPVERASLQVGRETYATAFTSIALRIEEVLSFSESLADPGKIREHHALRIAVKRLRYTLEVWRDLFDGTINKEIGALKEFQDLLGDLHDCDVWTEYLPEFLKGEEERCRVFFGNDTHFKSLVPGIEALARERRERRGQLHEITLTTWDELESRQFWYGLMEKFILPLALREDLPVRIGILGNISGDTTALRRVLAECYSRDASLVLNTGTSLGSPRASEKMVDILREEGVVSIATANDLQILDGSSSVMTEGDSGGIQSRKGQSKKTRKFFRTLPTSLRVFVAGKSILITGGSSKAAIGSFDEKTTAERLCEIANEAHASVIVSGSSRMPFTNRACDVLFVHPGSVGRGGVPFSTFSILEVGLGGSLAVTRHEIVIDPVGPGSDSTPRQPEPSSPPLGGEGQNHQPERY
ncbi:MAG TPA: CHAD domain-containing protein [Methanoregulaceae archaeon]|nr:CHAD domain-containing protein [Methanoregulaceae archaeon]